MGNESLFTNFFEEDTVRWTEVYSSVSYLSVGSNAFG